MRAGHHCTQPLMTRLGVVGDDPRELLSLLDPRGDRATRHGAAQGQGLARLHVEFEQLYREVILDHYKAPRNHGLLEPADAIAEGQNPLCGDEVTVSVRFGEGDVIEDVGFEGRDGAISQAATSMLTDLVKGRTAQEISAMPKDELLEEIGIPLTPGPAQVRPPRPRGAEGRAPSREGHAAPRGVGPVVRRDHRSRSGVAMELEALPLDELPDGSMRLVRAERDDDRPLPLRRASSTRSRIAARHDDGPSARASGTPGSCEVLCPRHGSRFDLRTGAALSLPGYLPVATYPCGSVTTG